MNSDRYFASDSRNPTSARARSSRVQMRLASSRVSSISSSRQSWGSLR
ncbi:MAG: hypothetical protein RMZ41_012990 [Nostoc sp. DedVER02]